jgi:DNA-binding PadR family transcriptional regulator
MFAHAIHTTGEGRRETSESYGFGCRRRTMMSGGSGPGKGRGRRRHHGFGPAGPFPGGGFPPGGRYGRSRKARRGDIRTAALLLLAEEPRNGYQIMQEVEERSGGVWRPSPGSVYPALSQLEDEGLIRSEEVDGRKRYVLSDAGRKLLDERDDAATAPWEEMSGEVSDQAFELGKLMREVGFAFLQVMRTGSEAQIAKAREVLAAGRRDLYRILADGDSEGEAQDEKD